MRAVHTGVFAALAGRTALALLAALGALGLGGPGCARTFRGEAVQPNPMTAPTEISPISEKITIVTGDMELEQPYAAEPSERATVANNHRYPLFNQASFTVVSRDRLRFHVQIDHKWEDWANPSTWDVHLEDDQGHSWAPDSVEQARTRLISQFWDREQRTTICSKAGRDPTGACISTVGLANDGWKRRQPLGTLSVFRGNADFVFYQHDLMRADIRKLRLVVKRPSEAFVFTWRFGDTVATD